MLLDLLLLAGDSSHAGILASITKDPELMSQTPRPRPPGPTDQRSGTLIEPVSQTSGRVPTARQPVEHTGTVLETDDEIRHALLATHKGRQAGPAVSIEPPEQAPPAPVQSLQRAAVAFRPTSRPRLAVLTVFDDGKTDGEVIRLRDHRFIIGRTEGDLRIPIDGRISARHVEITHQVVGGLHRWVVTDLQSTHGLFVRISKTVLADKAEFLVGNGRYRFDAPHADAGGTVEDFAQGGEFGSTRGLEDGASPFRPAAVTELIGADIGNRMLLAKNEYWIGFDPSCPICRPDDPFCEPRHVRLYRKDKGSWHAEHNKTVNGLWLRMPQITVESVAQFQIGEQRFQLRVK
jgi:FHA domain